MKTLYLTLSFVLITSLVYGQTDTGKAGHFENRLLQNVSIIKSDPTEATIIPDGPPAYPVAPVTGSAIEPCTLKRLVFFIHGLGGSGTSWERAANAVMLPSAQGHDFQARYCESFRLEYAPSYATMDGPAIDMKQDISQIANTKQGQPGYNPDKGLNFIIAHSQGGVVTRTLAHNDIVLGIDGYGGYVTVASSVQGAEILNNIPSLLFFAEEGCKDLLEGPLKEITPVTISPKINSILYGLNHSIVNNTCQTVAGVLPELFKDFTYQLTDHYKVGAQHIATMNNSASHPSLSQIHKIAFYGVEPRDNLIWRTLNWMVHNVNDEEPWMANDDFSLLTEKVIPVREEYFDHYWDNKILSEFYNLTGQICVPGQKFLNWSYIYRKSVRYQTKALAWKKGLDWLDRSTSGWTAIIGALSEQPTGTGCMCLYLEGGEHKYKTVNDCNVCYLLFPTSLISADPVTLMEWTYKESDGIVLAESARDLPGASFPPQKLNGIEEPGKPPTGSSHFQVRNDEGLRIHLKELLDGQLDPWFEMEPQTP